ncbi:MAG: hypothetical protein H6585_02890 [Flavobacteriales bacterium]|nr:hypothetical protein [Flavobacteriales bacterium]MCB9447273.1 hypothetical protein [Flavobacteriales bacterium]
MTKKKILLIGGVALTVAATVLLFTKTAKSKAKTVEINPAFGQYVSAYTAGVIQRNQSIRIHFTSDVATTEQLSRPVDDRLFSFQPSIDGKTTWLDASTIEFKPDKNLPSGQKYYAEFGIGKIMEVPEALEVFAFNFETLRQSMEVQVEGMKAFDKKTLQWQRIFGQLMTADIEELDKVKQTLTASQNGKQLPIQWQQEIGQVRNHFTVDSIVRGNDASEVIIQWNGKAIGCDITDEKKVEVPALGDFKLTGYSVIHDPDQYIKLQYSDPLDENQDLRGLVTLTNTSQLRYVIIDNEIMIYPASRIQGQRTLNTEPGIQNIMGYKTQERREFPITFEVLKPAVRFVGEGGILPESKDGLVIPFEAVSLRSVDVRVIRIFESNVKQFLQVNNITGEDELARVGKPVLQKTIRLDQSGIVDLGRWNRYALDLRELVQKEAGAIYRITIGFRKSQSLYLCNDADNGEIDDISQSFDKWQDAPVEHDASYWDGYEDYYYDEDYDYSERDNPCHPSYYGSRRSVSRNILASNIGLVAKRGEEGSMSVFVTDLRTALPLSGVTLEVVDYHQQVLASASTDGDGKATIAVKEKPFLLIAKQGAERGYLKLDDGSSLSLSQFDISGERIQKGVKGFLYGERGVWRPGDSLFATFILEDKLKTLPENHPLVFEFRNPEGQLVKRIVNPKSEDGFTRLAFKTDEDAPTGNWGGKVKIGAIEFSKTFKIENIKPNRLKIDMKFGTESIDATSLAGGIPFHTEWLHGGKAKNLDVKVDLTLAPSVTHFPKYNDYVFDDPTTKFYAEEQTLFEGKVDEEGNTRIEGKIESENRAPGMLTAKFLTKVFEPGGDFSQDRFSIPFHPFTHYAGLKLPKGDATRGMLLTDQDHPVWLVAVDNKGKPAPNRNLKVEFYKVEWRWWWDTSPDNLTSYNNDNWHSPLQQETVTTNEKGEATFNIRINYPDWGRYLVRVTDTESGHSSGKTVYIDWPGWAGRARNDGNGAALLTFNTDKESYTVGEEAVVTIPSAKGGRALLSIESGSKVLQSYWLGTEDGQTVFKLPVTKNFAPNAYLHVTLLQPHGQTVNDRPIRMYGVVPIKVVDPSTELHPEIKMPEVLRPEEDVKITVSEKDGHPMSYTLAIVDEGLLGLTRFKTPDPWPVFYAREALSVKTWDLYDQVIGAYGGKLDKLLAVGGDEVNKPKGGKKAQRFKPVVKYLGPFYLNGGSRTHTVHIPQYVGAVRTMVVAGHDGSYGCAEKSTPVKKPVMVLATMPRVLSPGEKVSLPVTVFAMEKNVRNVAVHIETKGQLKISGQQEQTINFDEPGDQTVNFNLKVIDAIGTGKVTVKATSGSETATYEVELDVRPPNPAEMNVVSQVLDPGASWSPDITAFGLPGTNKATVEISTLPPIDLERHLKYLIQYPHGCVEQTTSGVFPQLYLDALMELPESKHMEINRNINAGIQRLVSFQGPSGGLYYWPGNNSEYSEWGTCYAGHFLIEAAARGYNVPSSFFSNWVNYQSNLAVQWRYSRNNSDLLQAYRLYTLALAKNPDIGSMNRLKEQPGISESARWRLAAAYSIIGQPEAAAKLTQSISTDVKSYHELSYTFGSDDRDLALILETLVLMNKKEDAFKVMKKLSNSLSSDKWMSTQTASYALLSIGKYAKNMSADAMSFQADINGSVMKIENLKKFVAQKKFTLKPGSNKATMKNQSKMGLYVRVIIEGIPKAGEEMESAKDLQISVAYRNLDGKEVDPASIEQGTDFMAVVKVTHAGSRAEDYQQMALTQIFPSGWEIINDRMDGQSETEGYDLPTYEDIRDDRVHMYFNLNRGQTKVFRVLLNASYLGSYYLPAVQSYAMYDESIHARTKGRWVEVIQTPNP